MKGIVRNSFMVWSHWTMQSSCIYNIIMIIMIWSMLTKVLYMWRTVILEFGVVGVWVKANLSVNSRIILKQETNVRENVLKFSRPKSVFAFTLGSFDHYDNLGPMSDRSFIFRSLSFNDVPICHIPEVTHPLSYPRHTCIRMYELDFHRVGRPRCLFAFHWGSFCRFVTLHRNIWPKSKHY